MDLCKSKILKKYSKRIASAFAANNTPKPT